MFALINPLLYIVLAIVMLPAVFQFLVSTFNVATPA